MLTNAFTTATSAEMTTFHSDSQADLLEDLGCFDPFACESRRDRRDVADTQDGPIVWCALALVSHVLEADPAAIRNGVYFQVAFPR